jgi:hypothetical protein
LPLSDHREDGPLRCDGIKTHEKEGFPCSLSGLTHSEREDDIISTKRSVYPRFRNGLLPAPGGPFRCEALQNTHLFQTSQRLQDVRSDPPLSTFEQLLRDSMSVTPLHFQNDLLLSHRSCSNVLSPFSVKLGSKSGISCYFTEVTKKMNTLPRHLSLLGSPDLTEKGVGAIFIDKLSCYDRWFKLSLKVCRALSIASFICIVSDRLIPALRANLHRLG